MEFAKKEGKFLHPNTTHWGYLLIDTKIKTQTKVAKVDGKMYVLVSVLSGYYEGKEGLFPAELVGRK